MNDRIQICTECLSSTADSLVSPFCFNNDPHHWVDAVVTDCPFTHRDKRGTLRAKTRAAANRQCREDNHHFGLCAHIVPKLEGET